VVQEPLLPGNRHWHLSYSILDWFQTTVLESILSSQHGSGCYQYFGKLFVLSRKPDSGQLLGQFPDLDLGHQIHRPPDPGGKIPQRPQVENLKPNRHYALWTTCRHWSGSLVHSCLEDWPGTVGKWSFSIHASVDNFGPHTLYLSLACSSLNLLPSSAYSTLHFTKAPSAYTVWRNTHGHRRSLENALFTSMRVLFVWRGQPSYKGLPPPLRCLKVNCGTERGTNWRLDGSKGYSKGRGSVLHSREGFCLVQPVKSTPRSPLVNRFAVLNIEEVNTDICEPIDTPLPSIPDRKVLPQKPK